MSKLERIARNAGIVTGSLALAALSYVGAIRFAKIQEGSYSMEAFRDTMLCYRIQGIDHHECWSNEAARKKDFYQKMYDTLTFKNRE